MEVDPFFGDGDGGTPKIDLEPLVYEWPPPGAEPVVSFRVAGEPKPAGSKDTGVATRWDATLKRRVPVYHPDGRVKTFTKDSSGQPGKDWRSDLRSACSDALDLAHELCDGPMVLWCIFYRSRNQGDYGTGRNAGILKESAPRYPHRSRLADGTKLQRALEDALTKLVWTDDRRIVDWRGSRRFGPDGAHVVIYRLPELVRTPAPDGQEELLSA